MSRRREQALRERVIRGSTEGEREAALNALVKAVPAEVAPVKPAPWRAAMKLLVFVIGALLAATTWGWGLIGSVFAGVVFVWCAKWCGL